MTNNQPITTGIIRITGLETLDPNTKATTPRHRVYLSIPKNDAITIRLIRNAIADAAAEGMKDQWRNVDISNISMPIQDGDELNDQGIPFDSEYSQSFALTAVKFKKPHYVNLDLKPITDSKEIYSGIYVYASLRFEPLLYKGRPSIRCIIDAAMKASDGTPIKKSSAAEKAFAEIIKQLAPQKHKNKTKTSHAPTADTNSGSTLPENPEKKNQKSQKNNETDNWLGALESLQNRTLSLDEFKKQVAAQAQVNKAG